MLIRRILGALTVILARTVRWGFYRRVEVVGLEQMPRQGPVLIVANHYNGLVDAALVVATLGRLPRFVAKSTLGANPFVRALLWGLGVVLVKRPQDVAGAPGEANQAMFAATSAALADGDTVVIFPEGTTHDRPSLARIRTGAARIAIMAQARIDEQRADGGGGQAVRIVPVGVTYHDKIAVRSSALVAIGRPLPVSGGEPARDRVDVLTAAIEERLRSVSPDYDEDAIEWAAASHAAAIYLRTVEQLSPPFDARDRVVRQIRTLDDRARRTVLGAVAGYVLALDATGLDDELVLEGGPLTRSFRPVVLAAVAATLLAPVATFGLAVNAAPAGLVVASGLVTHTPFMKGTVRALVAIVAFPVAWTVAAVWLADPLVTQLGIAALAVVGGVVVLVGVQSALQAVEALVDWRHARERRVPIEAMRARRAGMVATVAATLGD